jgi:hypothetical protein
MASALLKATGLHTTDGLTQHVIGPGAQPTRRFICAVEINHALILGRRGEQRFILVHAFLGFLINKVNFCTRHAEPM